MARIHRSLLAATAAGLLGLGGIAAADSAPFRLTDAQMDDVVAAGFIHVVTETNTTVQLVYYHGYSNNPAPGPGPGTSSAEETTTTTTTTTMYCPGAALSSCYTGHGLNPNTQVLSVVTNSESSIGPRLSGPGNSFNNKFGGD